MLRDDASFIISFSDLSCPTKAVAILRKQDARGQTVLVRLYLNPPTSATSP